MPTGPYPLPSRCRVAPSAARERAIGPWRHIVRVALAPCAIACAGSLPGGCGAPPTEPPLSTLTPALLDAAPDDSTTAVGGLVRLHGAAWEVCTATLIAPNLILTARHCVAEVLGTTDAGDVDCATTTFGPAWPAHQIHFSVDPVLGPASDWHLATEITVPPEDSYCGNDLAVVRLDRPVSLQSAAPLMPSLHTGADRLPVEAAPYAAVGYAALDDGPTPVYRRRRADGLQVACAGVACGWPGAVLGAEWVGATGVCDGDSGGPAIDADGAVIGIASRGAAGCATPVYESPATWASLLVDAAREAASATGAEPPPWALPEDASPGEADGSSGHQGSDAADPAADGDARDPAGGAAASPGEAEGCSPMAPAPPTVVPLGGLALLLVIGPRRRKGRIGS